MSYSVLTAEMSHETNSFSIHDTDELAFIDRYVILGSRAIAARGQAYHFGRR